MLAAKMHAMAKSGTSKEAASTKRKAGAGTRRCTRVRRSYHTEELLPVIVVIVAVAMAGYLTIAVMLTIPGWLYWLYVVMKDRGRKLIDFSGGVSPDGTDVKYAIVKTQVQSIVELFTAWVDLERVSLPLPPPIKCSVFKEDSAVEMECASSSPDDESAEEKSDRLVRQEALRDGLHTLLALMKKNGEQHMGTEDARKLMEAGMVELAVRTAVSYYSSEAEVALALELVNRLAWHLMPGLDDLQELARRADIKKLLGLLSTAEAMGYPAVLRRGYQLLGNLSESVEVQQELVEAGVLQVVATGMRKNTKDPMVAQWGCFSLFHIMHMCPGVAELEKRRPGTLQALATETRDAMVAHKGKMEVQSCGCMCLWSIVALPERDTILNLRVVQDATGDEVMRAAAESFPKNTQIKEICGGLTELERRISGKA
mmetsp:Transcript_40848/g.68419  ORF Transcript_40848/g.68419 Transcript_40848/m.68419 type:complete len:428 (-) Transcript_40848:589-1872(-)